MTLPHASTQPGNLPVQAPEGQSKGVNIDQAIGMFQARTPAATGPRLRHPCDRQLKAIWEHTNQHD